MVENRQHQDKSKSEQEIRDQTSSSSSSSGDGYFCSGAASENLAKEAGGDAEAGKNDEAKAREGGGSKKSMAQAEDLDRASGHGSNDKLLALGAVTCVTNDAVTPRTRVREREAALLSSGIGARLPGREPVIKVSSLSPGF